MNFLIEKELGQTKSHIIDHATLCSILKNIGYSSIKDKIDNLKQKGIIKTLKKGLYVHTSQYTKNIISKEIIANNILSPSYISFDYALYYHGLIPESAINVTSATTKRSKTAFYGGTALKILYGLNRFSEDLDFTLLEKDDSFDIEKYFPFIVDEFEAFGVTIELKKKIKQNTSSDIESAFLKNNTSIHTLNIQVNNLEKILGGIHSGKKLKIKFEVDTNPPLKFQTEAKTLLMPKTFNIISMTRPNLYAGKMHAILFRNWNTRVKGRDWYDFEWYVKQNTKLNLKHLQERMYESGDLDKDAILDISKFKDLMYKKIDTLDINKVIEEVSPFIKDKTVFEFWSKEYFKLLTNKVEYQV